MDRIAFQLFRRIFPSPWPREHPIPIPRSLLRSIRLVCVIRRAEIESSPFRCIFSDPGVVIGRRWLLLL
jgi:hypothetical protein